MPNSANLNTLSRLIQVRYYHSNKSYAVVRGGGAGVALALVVAMVARRVAATEGFLALHGKPTRVTFTAYSSQSTAAQIESLIGHKHVKIGASLPILPTLVATVPGHARILDQNLLEYYFKVRP